MSAIPFCSTTHITSDLERVADYITFLHQGRVLMSNSKDELLLSHRVLRCGWIVLLSSTKATCSASGRAALA